MLFDDVFYITGAVSGGLALILMIAALTPPR
jgi:hypothetical protein